MTSSLYMRILLLDISDVFDAFWKLVRVIQNENGLSIAYIQSDHGGEFQNEELEQFYNENGIKHTFSNPTYSSTKWDGGREK